MADIDHFKTFNDTCGHLTGDQVLRLVAMSVKQNVKGQDIAARYGGEEFVIALPNTALRSAAHRRRPHPPRGHDQGIDEALDRREARPRDHLARRRTLHTGDNAAAPDRARRQPASMPPSATAATASSAKNDPESRQRPQPSRVA